MNKLLKELGDRPQSNCELIISACSEQGFKPSVGSTGDSYDNAMAESVIGLYKTEVIHRRRTWKTFEEVEYTTLLW